MPRRKRAAMRREDPHEVAVMFLYGDGVRPLLDGDPVAENPFLARAAWNRARARTWELWDEFGQARPPTGAVRYDDLTEGLWDAPRGTAVGELLQLARADLRAVETFRSHDEAEEAEPSLTTFEGILLAAIAELEAAPADEPPPSDRTWKHVREPAS